MAISEDQCLVCSQWPKADRRSMRRLIDTIPLAGVKPGGGRLIGCLKEHENDVTIGCVKELKAIKSKMGKDRNAAIRQWIG